VTTISNPEKQGTRFPARSAAEESATIEHRSAPAGLGRDARELLTLFCPFLAILALAAVAVIVVSGQFPWFVLPLAVFFFFASCLPWKRFP
jgi:fatty acid desaturase